MLLKDDYSDDKEEDDDDRRATATPPARATTTSSTTASKVEINQNKRYMLMPPNSMDPAGNTSNKTTMLCNA